MDRVRGILAQNCSIRPQCASRKSQWNAMSDYSYVISTEPGMIYYFFAGHAACELHISR